MNVRVAALLALAGTCFAAGWKVSEWRNDAIQAELYRLEDERNAENRRLVAEIARVNREAISQIRIENRTIYQKARREVVHEPIYVDCVVPDDGSGLLNQARSDAGDDRSGSADTVPADADDPDPAGRDD